MVVVPEPEDRQTAIAGVGDGAADDFVIGRVAEVDGGVAASGIGGDGDRDGVGNDTDGVCAIAGVQDHGGHVGGRDGHRGGARTRDEARPGAGHGDGHRGVRQRVDARRQTGR